MIKSVFVSFYDFGAFITKSALLLNLKNPIVYVLTLNAILDINVVVSREGTDVRTVTLC